MLKKHILRTIILWISNAIADSLQNGKKLNPVDISSFHCHAKYYEGHHEGFIHTRIAGGSRSHLSHRMSYVGIFKLSTHYLIADIDIIFFKNCTSSIFNISRRFDIYKISKYLHIDLLKQMIVYQQFVGKSIVFPGKNIPENIYLK